MGWWIGTVIFAGLYVLLAVMVHLLGKKGDNECALESGSSKYTLNALTSYKRFAMCRLKHLMVATAVFCCWYMWAVMYWAQMYPIPNPVLKELEEHDESHTADGSHAL